MAMSVLAFTLRPKPFHWNRVADMMPNFCILCGSNSSLVLQTEHPPAAGVHHQHSWKHNSQLASVTHGLHIMPLILTYKARDRRTLVYFGEGGGGPI